MTPRLKELYYKKIQTHLSEKFSLKNKMMCPKIDKIVVKIGAANEMLTTVAKGRFLNAVNIAKSAIKPKKHLKKCNPGLLV